MLGARALIASWGAQPSVTVYLRSGASEVQGKALADAVRAQEPDIEVIYVSPAKALERLRAQLGDLGGALDGLPANPLPPSVELTPRDSADARALAVRLSRLPGVVDVDYGREWLDRLEALGRAMGSFGAGGLLVVLTAALLVVVNTIRLAVYVRRDEIEIMKLVGATDTYVRMPFLLEGALQGIIGSLLALGGLLAAQKILLPRAAAAFAFAAGAAAPKLATPQAVLLVALGGLVGLCGSYLAVAKFLRA
jgi:cell division transport system permease protein